MAYMECLGHVLYPIHPDPSVDPSTAAWPRTEGMDGVPAIIEDMKKAGQGDSDPA